MFTNLIAPAKQQLRKPYREFRTKFLRRFRGFGATQLVDVLRDCGIEPGDAICVHSGMTGFAGFRGSVAEIVRSFLEAAGGDGAILMPTFSFEGSAVEYARSGAVFDPKRTPSRTGLISEVFRRFPQVERSIHPTHSLAVKSADARSWIGTHLEADTPCGKRSPFEQFAERKVKIVFAGASPATLSYFHFIEELLEPRMPFSPFTQERFSLAYRSGGVVAQSPPMRLYDPEVSRRRTLTPLFMELQRGGKWKAARTGTLDVVVLRARDVLDAAESLAARNIFCYK
ncbi:MAG TPA: AAC(3) family N-acetyltransferase [Bryobacteraceae bacterium]|nr:AAC(3) family N-acetyltransferase [Bryobacteraceae bacterium]